MTSEIVAGLLLNFSAMAAIVIKQFVSRRGLVEASVLSQKLYLPLTWGGTIAVFAAIYAFVSIDGWRAGLGMWALSGFLSAAVAVPLRTWADGVLSIVGLVSLIVGASFFWRLFL